MVYLRLQYYPIIDSMHVYLNGLEQREEVDWHYSDGLINVLSPMEALSADKLECYYTHLNVPVPPAPEPEGIPFITGNNTDLSFGYRFNFVLPTGVLPGDMMLVHWASWHGWSVDPSWTTVWNTGGSNNQVICYKFITTEVAGYAMIPNDTNGQGFRSSGVCQLLRGVDQSNPIVDHGNNGSGGGGTTVTATDTGQMVVHMVANFGNGPCDDPTLSRGTETAHDYIGNMGVRASTEILTAGQSVTCTTGGTGFVSSTVLRTAP